MKAVTPTWRGRKFVEDLAVPKAQAGEVVVRVAFAAINPVDYKLPFLLTKAMGKKVVGLDLAGVVSETASSEFEVGDRVFGTASGTLCEFALCKEAEIAKVPDEVELSHAAAMPTTFLSAFQGFNDFGMKPGSRVLVIGASGGCGTAGVMLAKAMGAARVVGVCSGENADMVKDLGADEIIDYRQGSVAEACEIFDFVYDTATGSGSGEDYVEQSHRVLTQEGMYVALNGSPMSWIRHLTGFNMGNDRMLLTKHRRADLEGILKALGKGTSRVPIERVLPFDEESVEEGFAALKSRRSRGKIIFRVSDD